MFLEADEAVLVQRFKETRRKHPLTGPDTPLLEGIRLERKLLEPLAFNPSIRIDTTHATPHELRARVQDFAAGGNAGRMTLLFESFGYKKGTPIDADYVFDVRCLPNPHWQIALRPHTGRDPEVIAFLEKHPEVEKMFVELRRFLGEWLPGFEAERRSYMTVAIGCTGGRHRSVTSRNGWPPISPRRDCTPKSVIGSLHDQCDYPCAGRHGPRAAGSHSTSPFICYKSGFKKLC